MPKGEKPIGANFLAVEEVATTLRVGTSQVLEWIQKDQLRGNDSGIKPYDLKKFQLDQSEEIRKAQAKALKDSQKPVDKKPNKGGGPTLLSKLTMGMFGKGKPEGETVTASPASDGNLALENKRLRDELLRLRTEAKDDAVVQQLEDKVRFLEGQAARSRELESEIGELKRRLESSPAAGPGAKDWELQERLESTQRELSQAQDKARESEELRQSLLRSERERDRLLAELESLPASASSPTHEPIHPSEEADRARDNEEEARLRAELEDARQSLQQADDQLRIASSESEELRSRHQRDLAEREDALAALRLELAAPIAHRVEDVVAASPTNDLEHESSELIDELLALQETNLSRFARLHEMHQQAQERLAQAPPSSGGPTAEASLARLQSEFDNLRVKHQSLLEARESNAPESQEYAEQLAAARVNTGRLKQENAALKARLSEADVEGWKARAEELQDRLQGSSANDASLELLENELRTARKNLQSREAQVQKIAGRVQENERALKKALKESTRLTELLIERENRLRDLSTEYEQEYRDKVDNLDRQVSGLQWKLSLREERIANLESEVGELRKNAHRP